MEKARGSVRSYCTASVLISGSGEVQGRDGIALGEQSEIVHRAFYGEDVRKRAQ